MQFGQLKKALIEWLQVYGNQIAFTITLFFELKKYKIANYSGRPRFSFARSSDPAKAEIETLNTLDESGLGKSYDTKGNG